MITQCQTSRCPVSRRGGFAVILAVFLVSLVYLTLCMNRNVHVYDEGVVLFDASLALDGAIPHRDFYTIYGPGQIYILAGLYKIFGASVLVERAWDTIVRGIIVTLVLIIVSQAAPRGLALLAAGASLVCLAAFGGYSYSVYPTLAAVLGGVAILTPALSRQNSFAALIASGACAGCATLFRYDAGVAIFGAECALLAFSAWYKRRVLASAIRDAVWLLGLFGAGFAVIVVPMVVAFALAGAIPDILFQVVNYGIEFYAKMRGLPFPRPWNISGDLTSLAVYLPLCFCAAAAPVLTTIWHCRTTNEFVQKNGGHQIDPAPIWPWSVLTLVVISLVFFAKGVVRVGVIGMAMSLITTIALACILTQSLPGRGRVGAGILGVSLLGMAAFIVSSLHTDFNRFERNVAWVKNPASWELSGAGAIPELGSCRMPPGLERLACFRVSPAEFETIRFVQQHTTPDEPLFVGLDRHDRILMNDVLLYFAANRRPVTKWYHFDPGQQTLLPIQQEMIRELRHANPRLIVLEANWSTESEPNESAISSGVTALDDFIRSKFDPVAIFGGNTVLVARRQNGPDTPMKP